ncbi:MAG: serine kinase [Haliea sp.]|nr:serine kinase [Haliea sp.]
MDDQLAFANAAREGFRRASAASGIIERYYRIAQSTILLRFAGDALLEPITPALEHLRLPEAAAADFTIDLFDSRSTATSLPFLLDRYIQLMRLRWWEQLGTRREIKGMNSERIRSVFHLGPDILSVLDQQENHAVYWVEDAADIPYYETGYPLSVLLNWWFGKRNHFFVHAACFGTDNGSVLLTGKGGSGKSTTTLACLDSGLRLSGDDYCVVHPERLMAYSVYNTIKLKGLQDVERFAHLKSCIDNLERVQDAEEGEKAMIFLQRYFPEQLLPASVLRAILVPRVADQQETVITPASASHVFKAIMPSTLFQLPGNAQEEFRALASLVRSVPSYEIALGSDIAAIPGVIRQFLQDQDS